MKLIYKYLPPEYYNAKVKPYFDRMLQHHITLNEKEFNRIKGKKDFGSLHKLLYLIKIGSMFNEEVCSKAVFDKYTMLREKIIHYVETNVPMNFIKSHLASIKDHMINVRNKVGKPFGIELDNTEGVKKINVKYYINIEGKHWQITQINLGDKHESVGTVIFSLVDNKTNKKISCSVKYSNLYTKYGRRDKSGKFNSKFRLDTALIKKRMAKAYINFSKHEKNQAVLRKFDLPEDKPIGYISLFPSKPDYVIDNNQEYSIYFARLLKSLGYQLDLSAMNADI